MNTTTTQTTTPKQAPTIMAVLRYLKQPGDFKRYHDPNGLHYVRLAGDCVTCTKPVYQISEGSTTNWRWFDPDPRGPLGEHRACSSLKSNEYGMLGPDVYQCFDCAKSYEIGLHYAREKWVATIESVTIVGRKWFDKIKGYTYHSVKILVNGRTVGSIACTPGSGDQYVWTGYYWLIANNFIQNVPEHTSGSHDLSGQGFHLEYFATDVSRKKDL